MDQGWTGGRRRRSSWGGGTCAGLTTAAADDDDDSEQKGCMHACRGRRRPPLHRRRPRAAHLSPPAGDAWASGGTRHVASPLFLHASFALLYKETGARPSSPDPPLRRTLFFTTSSSSHRHHQPASDRHGSSSRRREKDQDRDQRFREDRQAGGQGRAAEPGRGARRRQRPLHHHRLHGLHVQVRHGARAVEARRRQGQGRQHPALRRRQAGSRRLRRQEPGGDPVGRGGRRVRGGVHRRVHRQGQGGGSPQGRRQEGGDHRAQQGRAHVRGGRQRGQVHRGPRRRVQRQLHHQLPRAARQGRARQLRHRRGAHDHRPRRHSDPEDGGRAVGQGLEGRPGRQLQHHPQQHRRRQGRGQGAPRAQREADRHGVPRADGGRVRRRPHRQDPEARLVRRHQGRRQGGGRGEQAEGDHGVHRRGPGVDGLRGRQQVEHLRRQGRHRAEPALRQAGGLVRQRVGLQLPRRRPHPPHGQDDGGRPPPQVVEELSGVGSVLSVGRGPVPGLSCPSVYAPRINTTTGPPAVCACKDKGVS